MAKIGGVAKTYFEEVDRIKVFRGVNKQLVLGRELIET